MSHDPVITERLVEGQATAVRSYRVPAGITWEFREIPPLPQSAACVVASGGFLGSAADYVVCAPFAMTREQQIMALCNFLERARQ